MDTLDFATWERACLEISYPSAVLLFVALTLACIKSYFWDLLKLKLVSESLNQEI